MFNLTILKDKYAVCKFKNDADIPGFIYDSEFYSITKTPDELSIVCRQSENIRDIKNMFEVNKDWRIIKVKTPLDFSSIGVISGISGILKENKISILTISTYETDYILVKNKDLRRVVDSLKESEYKISYEN